MKYEQLSAEDQALLNTQFPEELEKEAAAEVEQATELYTIGFEKLAVEAADALDKLAEESEAEEKKEEEKKELSEEHKKEAADRAAFIARAYCDGLMKLGAERHNNELHYFIPAIEEKLAMRHSSLSKVTEPAKKALHGLKENARKAVTGEKLSPEVKARAGRLANEAKSEATKKKMKAMLAGSHLSVKDRAMEAGKAVAKGSAVAVPAGMLAHKVRSKKDS